MKLLAVGCSFRTAPVALRERLAGDDERQKAALVEMSSRYGCEAALLATCNRVEVYAGGPAERTGPDAELLGEFLAEFYRVAPAELRPHLYAHPDGEAVRHLFRVAAGLDSLVVGEGQIAGQVKRAYELGRQAGSVGPLLHALFRHARTVAGRVRTETAIGAGHASVATAAVDYVGQVFSHFGDKTVLVIGAGKMGGQTLCHLSRLRPRRILVTNRSPDKARAVAAGCAGQAVPWSALDAALVDADIVLSTTGAPEPVVSLERYQRIRPHRGGRPVVILDIAVPRDFDPRIHDGETTCLFNIDDLRRTRDQALRERARHVAPAEAIIEEERERFLRDWSRRRTGPVIARLTEDLEAKRRAVVEQLLAKLNGRLTAADREYIEGAFRVLQNQFLHGPISALTQEAQGGGGHHLLEALRKLFRV